MNEYIKDLSLFEQYQRTARQQAEIALQQMKVGVASAQIDTNRYDPYIYFECDSWQRNYCEKRARVYYLEASAISLCESLCGPSIEKADFPEEPLWIQPLAPLPFRNRLLRGIFLYDRYNVDRLSLFPIKNPQKKYTAQEYWKQRHGIYQVDIFLANPGNTSLDSPGEIILFGEYDMRSHRWSRSTAPTLEGYKYICPRNECRVESLGGQNIVVQCEQCRQEFIHWTQWLEVLFLAIQGNLRRVNDTTPFEELDVPFPASNTFSPHGKKAKKNEKGDRPRQYHATIIRYDASYFKPIRRQSQHGSLLDSHIVLTTDEALREGALEVDMDGVLIRDTVPRAAHTRTLVHPRFHKSQANVKFKPDMPHLISLATWKARRRQHAEALHKQVAVYSSTHEQSPAIKMVSSEPELKVMDGPSKC